MSGRGGRGGTPADGEGERGGRPTRSARGGRTLVQEAVRKLASGPASTMDLARDVLGLEGGSPEVLAAAIVSLLGPDPRFRRDESGVWSLVDSLRGVGPSLGYLDYAVVDVETTGGEPGKGHRIIEVAVVEIRDGMISRDFRTLVNPGRTIPENVVQLTGISNEAVQGAPYFDQIADELVGHLEGRVFVAQNAPFDRRFIESELLEARGEVPPAEILCTVRMARRLVPDLRKRNLDALARHFGIEIHGRHRAYGDAMATARIFLRLLDEAGRRGIHDLSQLVESMGGDLGSDRSDPAPDPDADDPLESIPPIPPLPKQLRRARGEGRSERRKR